MSKRNNIILIGFMGSGKTTFGKWIAANKKMEFVDTDELIEKENGITISDIFASKGEVYFRNLETEMLNKLLERDTQNCVISVGGGLPVKEENRELLSQLGTVVYLWADADELVKRLIQDRFLQVVISKKRLIRLWMQEKRFMTVFLTLRLIRKI